MPARTALVVEDNPTMRQLIVLALNRIHGMRVVEAADGVDALKKRAPPARYDIILTDIIVTTESGASAFITKPFQAPRLIETVLELLGAAV